VTLGTLFHLAEQHGWRGLCNRTIAQNTGRLLARGIEPHTCLDLMLAFNSSRCNPPFPEDEIAATVASISQRDFLSRAKGGARHDR
jgi:hypothetical protein